VRALLTIDSIRVLGGSGGLIEDGAAGGGDSAREKSGRRGTPAGREGGQGLQLRTSIREPTLQSGDFGTSARRNFGSAL